MERFRAVAKAVVATGLLGYAKFDQAAEIASGWWDTEEKAMAELEYLMESQLAAGCYHVQTIIERSAA